MKVDPKKNVKMTAALATLAGTLGVVMLDAARRSRWQWHGKVVLITGGSRGLGLILARQLAAKGARLSICARDLRELERAREELEALGGAPVLAQRCDVSRPEEVSNWISASLHRFGAIDVLINNASIIQVGPVEAMAYADLKAAMDINFWGSAHTVFAALPHLYPGARIVNITSIGAAVAVPHLLPYCCAKFATLGLSLGLRAELAKRKIKVVTVLPGLMRTGSFLNALVKGNREREVNWFSLSSSLPLFSMDAERAGRQIVDAAARGRGFIVLSWQAKLLRAAYVAAPGPRWMSGLLGWVNRVLPDASAPGFADREQVAEKARDHRSGLSRSFLTSRGDRAARKFAE